MSKEQYDELKPHMESINRFNSQGSWTGDNVVFNLYKNITGFETNESCNGCKAATLKDLYNMVNKYEGRL